MNKQIWKQQNRVLRLLRRYRSIEQYVKRLSRRGAFLACFAAADSLEVTAMILHQNGVDMEWDSFSEPPHLLSAKRKATAWEEITPSDVDRILSGDTVSKVHCLTCGG